MKEFTQDEPKECNIQTNVITKKQTPETDEALKLLETAKSKINNLVLIPFLLSVFLSILMCILNKFYISIPFIALGIIDLIIYFVYRSHFLKPYYSLLEIAIRNDNIRHEERIRFRERKRLEDEYNNQLIVDKKEKIKIEKNATKNIATMKKLAEEKKLPPIKESTFVEKN